MRLLSEQQRVSAIVVNFLQIGVIFAPDTIQPKLSKLNPLEKLKKIFSKDSVIEILKSIAKIIALGTILTIAIYTNIPALFGLIECNLGCVLPILAHVMKNILTYAVLFFIVVAVIDYFFKRKKYIKDLMMTKDEVKQEFKEAEGDPHIKGKRKQLAREVANSQQMGNIKKTSVVITN